MVRINEELRKKFELFRIKVLGDYGGFLIFWD